MANDNKEGKQQMDGKGVHLNIVKKTSTITRSNFKNPNVDKE